MDTLQCAVVLAKLERFDWEVSRRLALGDRYRKLIESGGASVGLLGLRPDRDCVWAQFTIFTDRRSEVQAKLLKESIPTAIHYPMPLHLQPAYQAFGSPHDCPNSVGASERVLSLPMSADLSEADLARVVDALACV
jgi:UDP-2-acetamido-2-deoxy-ribo-hexuluronate aminotransferase